MTPTPEQLRVILQGAIQAPSADNCHRFLLEPAGESLRLWYREGEIGKIAGYKRILVLLSLGAVVENIKVSADALGIRAEVAFFPDSAKPDLICRVRWTAGGGSPDTLAEVIVRRHTNRKLVFRGPRLSEAALEALVAEVRLYACDLVWLDRPTNRREAVHLMRLAETERFGNQQLHQELFSAIRFDVGWTAGCDDGLPPGALEVEPGLRRGFSLMRHWPVMRSLKFLGVHVLLGVRAAYLPARWAPHLGLVTARRTGDQDLLAAGQAFQRIWLRLAMRGMAVQPMPAAPLYALPRATEEGVPVRLQSRLAAGWDRICPGSTPLMLFRTGFASPSAIQAGRPNVERFLCTGKRRDSC